MISPGRLKCPKKDRPMYLTVNSKKTFCATGGKPFDNSQPPILFIHGASFDHTTWKLQARYFAWNGCSVLAVDLPGHGLSDGPPLDSIQEMANWIESLLNAAGIPSTAIVGHSMGAQIAMDFAARFKNRVYAIALLGAAITIPVNSALLNPAAVNDHMAFDLLNSWGYGRRAQLGGHRMPGLWFMRGGLRVMERSAKGVLHKDLVATNNYSGEDAVTEINCPTLIIIGEKDMMTPLTAGISLADRIGGSKHVILSDLGHIMMEEDPDATLDALREFLSPLQS